MISKVAHWVSTQKGNKTLVFSLGPSIVGDNKKKQHWTEGFGKIQMKEISQYFSFLHQRNQVFSLQTFIDLPELSIILSTIKYTPHELFEV